MEYVDGVNLRQMLQGGRIRPREALAIVPQICEALQFAHDQGIVHRDIKPENILVDRRGRLKVADFGLARLMGGQETASQHARSHVTGQMTEAGQVMGTPDYMAPEQIETPLEVDHRADIYALGVVFYQMLTGELPGNQIEAPSKKVQIDVRLDEIVLRTLEQKPELRFQQASLLKTEIETIAAEPSREALDERSSKKIPREIFWGNIAVCTLFAGILLTLIFHSTHTLSWGANVAILAFSFLLAWLFSVLSWKAARTHPHTAWRWEPAWTKSGTFGGRLGQMILGMWIGQQKGMVWKVPATVAIMLFLMTCVFATFRMESDAASPELPKGSFVFANRLARKYSKGDLIAYYQNGERHLGRVLSVATGRDLAVKRRNEPPSTVPKSHIIGKVVFATRGDGAGNVGNLDTLEQITFSSTDPRQRAMEKAFATQYIHFHTRRDLEGLLAMGKYEGVWENIINSRRRSLERAFDQEISSFGFRKLNEWEIRKLGTDQSLPPVIEYTIGFSRNEDEDVFSMTGPLGVENGHLYMVDHVKGK